jgi:hypothetical protein
LTVSASFQDRQPVQISNSLAAPDHFRCPLRGIRYRGDPAASPAMSAVTPKAEVNSERWRSRYGPLRVVSASFTRVSAQLGNATVGAAEPPAKFAVDILHHHHIGVDVGLVIRVEVSGRELVQHRCALRDDGG